MKNTSMGRETMARDEIIWLIANNGEQGEN